MQSMQDFMNDSNHYDDRINMLSEWLARKENEYKSRINLPPKHLKKTDNELFNQYDKDLKRARESLVAKMIDKESPKNYDDLTSLELHNLSESLAIRLHLFNYEYPRFLP